MATKPLIPKGGGTEGDLVMTPRPLAKAIIDHFRPRGYLIDPCRGNGAFYDQFPPHPYLHEHHAWCEITQGVDFLTDPAIGSFQYDWCISNPPWSQFRAFTKRAMQCSDNTVWLCTVNHFWLKARLRDMDEAGFGIKEILLVATPPAPWPQSGFQCAAVHIQRGYKGPITMSRLPTL